MFSYNNQAITFSEKEYLAQSKNYSRDEMPQIKFDRFLQVLPELRSYLTIIEMQLPARVLKPTQKEINLDKVFMSIAKYGVVEDEYLQFICSKDLYFVDGHHRHVQTLITDENRLVKCFVFDLTIDALMSFLRRFDEILSKPKDINEDLADVTKAEIFKLMSESFGTQGPEALPGIGGVASPDVATSAGDMLSTEYQKGSGDMFDTIKFSTSTTDEDERLAEAIKTMRAFMPQISEAKIEEVEGSNLKLDVHFESYKDVENELSECQNLPISRKFKQIDTPFSCNTLEGICQGKANDYLVVGLDNEIYPCDQQIFEATYKKL